MTQKLKATDTDLQNVTSAASDLCCRVLTVPVIFTTSQSARLIVSNQADTIRNRLCSIIAPLIQRQKSAEKLLALHVHIKVRESRAGCPELLLRCVWLFTDAAAATESRNYCARQLISENQNEEWVVRPGEGTVVIARSVISNVFVQRFPMSTLVMPGCDISIRDPALRWLSKTKLASLGATFSRDSELSVRENLASNGETLVQQPLLVGDGVGMNPCWPDRQILACSYFSHFDEAQSAGKSAVPETAIAAETDATQSSKNLINPKLLRQLAGDIGSESIPLVVDAFIDELTGQIEQLKQSSDASYLPELARVVHTLKSSAGTLGASALYSSASAVDAMFKQESNDEIPSALADMAIVATDTLKAYKSFNFSELTTP